MDHIFIYLLGFDQSTHELLVGETYNKWSTIMDSSLPQINIHLENNDITVQEAKAWGLLHAYVSEYKLNFFDIRRMTPTHFSLIDPETLRKQLPPDFEPMYKF